MCAGEGPNSGGTGGDMGSGELLVKMECPDDVAGKVFTVIGADCVPQVLSLPMSSVKNVKGRLGSDK